MFCENCILETFQLIFSDKNRYKQKAIKIISTKIKMFMIILTLFINAAIMYDLPSSCYSYISML